MQHAENGCKRLSRGQFRSFWVQNGSNTVLILQRSVTLFLGQQDISAPVSSVFEALGTVSCGLE